jgi:mRNA-degrading endonuclease RelE of RelBE toxin-antitoxin system
LGADDLGVTHAVVWSIQAARARRRLREQDPDGTALLTAAINALADDPRPDNAAALGGSGWFYLRLGQFRAVYEVRDDQGAVYVNNVGRLPPPRH